MKEALELKGYEVAEKEKVLKKFEDDLSITYCMLYQLYASVQRQFSAKVDLSFLENSKRIQDTLNTAKPNGLRN